MSKKHLNEFLTLEINEETGIARLFDYSAGSIHSVHPNIEESSSLEEMISQGDWHRRDIVVASEGYLYNVSRLIVEDEKDRFVAKECQCAGCRLRKTA